MLSNSACFSNSSCLYNNPSVLFRVKNLFPVIYLKLTE